MPYATLRFSCHPGMFLSSRSRFLHRHRLFFIPSSRIAGAPLLHQPGICLSRLISRAFFFSPDTFNPATARRYTILPPHSTHSNGSRFRNCFTTCTLKWHTEFGHLNRGDMLTSEQHRCHNEKKKFQRRV